MTGRVITLVEHPAKAGRRHTFDAPGPVQSAAVTRDQPGPDRRRGASRKAPLFARSNDLFSSTYLLETLVYFRVMAGWSFLTNHAQALLCIAHDPGVRLIDIAAALGITERSAYAIVDDLTKGGYVVKEKEGRRNRYEVQGHLPLPDPVIRSATVGDALALLIGNSGAEAPVAQRKPPALA